MSRSDRDVLSHILEEIDYLAAESASLEAEDFLHDETHKRAFVRSIEVVGEAAKKISPETKALAPEVEWRAVTGMRDHLIHGYFNIDYDIVWDVIQRKMPELRPSIVRLIQLTEWENGELTVTDPGNIWQNVNPWLDRLEGHILHVQFVEKNGQPTLQFRPLSDRTQAGMKISTDPGDRALWQELSRGATRKSAIRYLVRYRWDPLDPE